MSCVDHVFVCSSVEIWQIVDSMKRIQESLMLVHPQLEQVMVPVATIHLTLMVMRLDTADHIQRLLQLLNLNSNCFSLLKIKYILFLQNIVLCGVYYVYRAKLALENSGSKIRELYKQLISIQLSGVGSFGGSVLFAKLANHDDVKCVAGTAMLVAFMLMYLMMLYRVAMTK